MYNRDRASDELPLSSVPLYHGACLTIQEHPIVFSATE